MSFIALRMLTGDRAKYFGLVFAIAFCTFLLENQTSIFANILKRTASQILDVTDAEVWVMDPKTEYWEQTKALKDTDLTRVRGVPGVQWAVRLFKGNPVAKTLDGKFAVVVPDRPRRRDARGRAAQDAAGLLGAPARARLGRRRQGRLHPALPGRAARARAHARDERPPRDDRRHLRRLGAVRQPAGDARPLQRGGQLPRTRADAALLRHRPARDGARAPRS